jgi:UDP-N-acetylmuramyl pentapeptide phosphotransferase/UDP-N-acetylglucosamine-1-phosphate transferase
LVRPLLVRGGVVDRPNHRSSHSVTTARGGGVACLVGVAAGGLVAHGDTPWVAIAVAAVLAVVGFADDVATLPAGLRLVLQLLCGGALGLALGGGWGLVVAAVVVLPTVVNIVNFMDGINGITGFTMTLWGATAMVLGTTHDSRALAIVGAVTAGAALGFLPYNIPVARLFLGDAGSYLFGALVSVGLLLAWQVGAPVAVAVAPLGLHLFDTGLTVARRAVAGESLMVAHRQHLYQRLVLRLSHVKVSLIFVTLALLTTLAWSVGLVVGAVGTVLALGTYLCLALLVTRRPPAPAMPPR